MGNFPSAAAQIQPVDVPSPLDQMGKVQAMKNVMQRAQLGGIEVQKGQMELQQAQQQQKDLQLYSKAYIMANGDSAKARDVFLQQGGSLPFWQKVDDLHNEAVSKEQDRQIKLTQEQRAADTAKQQKIGNALFAVSSIVDPDVQHQEFDRTAKALVDDKTIKPEELKAAFPNGYPGPVMLRMAALKSMEISKQVEATKPTQWTPGNIPVSPAGVAGAPIGEKAPPTPTNEDKAISDYMASHNLPDTASNRHLARLRLKAEGAAAGRAPEKPGDQGTIETTAGDYLDEANGDANKALAQLEKDVQAKSADPMLRRYAARIRFRIRERVRPGVPAGRRDRLGEILGETK